MRMKLGLAAAVAVITIVLAANGFRTEGTRAQSTNSIASEPGRKYLYTRARYQRGQYLVENVAHCFMCHSETDWNNKALPIAGRKGAGRAKGLPDFPFLLPVPNITPDTETGAGTFTDEQFVHALRDGIGHDGRVLFPLMPYLQFRQMSEEDLASIIVYVRSVQPVKNTIPKRPDIPEPFNALVAKPAPPAGPFLTPDLSTREKRGSYLVTIGNCAGCHTTSAEDGMTPILSMHLAGNNVMEGPWGAAAPANLTPDPSGISYYDEAMFIQTIRTGRVKARTLKPIMLWGYFRGMRDEDLKDIFAYLRSIPPVRHRVDNTEPVSYCKVCRGKHGGGSLN